MHNSGVMIDMQLKLYRASSHTSFLRIASASTELSPISFGGDCICPGSNHRCYNLTQGEPGIIQMNSDAQTDALSH